MTTTTSAATSGDAAVCGACGYSTRGLSTLVCPECGGDFRRVGIVVPRPDGRRTSGVRGQVIVTALALGAVIFIAVSMLNDLVPPLVPTPRAYEERQYFKLPRATGATRSYYVVGRARTWTELRPTLSVSVEMMEGGARLPRTLPVRGDRVAEADVRAWMSGLGVKDSDPLAAQEAAEIVRLVSQVTRPTELLTPRHTARTSQSPLKPTGRRSSFASSPPARDFVRPILSALGWIAWLAALCFLWSRGRPRGGATSSSASAASAAFTPPAGGE